MSESGPVLVTGASGYIALHVIQQLQQAGYRVRGTVRSVKNEDKVAPIRQVCPEARHPIELVEADLTKDDGWTEAVRGCEYVIHMASPFPLSNPRDPDEVIKPAVNGTLSVLRACKEVGGVKRVVLTSSIVAVTDGTETRTFTEEDWLDVDKTSSVYYKSKALAERAAWDFIAELPDADKFELAVINPGYVLGPVLTKSWASSMEVHKRLLQREVPALPRVGFALVDVRDVAKAHINAMTSPDAAGRRHLLVNESLWFKDMAVILAEEFKSLGYKVPVKEAPHFLVKVTSWFNKDVKMLMPTWGKLPTVDNSRMKNVLNVQPRPIKETLVEMAYSMIQTGFVKKTQKYIDAKEK